ncbi:efflux RND transporter periplasmic adaptor subunit, partial [Marinobacter alexandrii]|uniref:efflux RND transporter periplasmic adaptor subunit n=1 Tax=Marinobacter alexandrii TaxID=2570351 RepID=UPI00329874A8
MGTISKMEQTAVDAESKAAVGASMDRVIEKKRSPAKIAGLALAIVGVVVLVAYWFTSPGGRSLSIANDRVMLSPVQTGIFEDTIPVRARVAPLKTVFLDAIQGGRVEEILIEDGTEVEIGQPIARLSNSDLQLSVMNTESRVMEQLNSMRDQ